MVITEQYIPDFTAETSQPAVSIGVPAYNESYRRDVDLSLYGLGASLATGNRILDREFGRNNYEIVVIDDGSADGTAEFAHENGATRVLSYPQNRGRGYALKTFFENTKGQNVRGWVDADHSYSWDEHVLGVMEPVLAGYSDIAVAVRHNKLSDHDGIVRLIGHVGVATLANLIAPAAVRDTQGGLQMYSTGAAEEVWPHVQTERWGANREALRIAEQKGFRVAPVHAVPRPVGDSRVHFFKDTVQIVNEAYTTRHLHP